MALLEAKGDTTAAAALRIWALLFGMGLILTGNGLQSSLLGLRAASESFGDAVTGMVMSGYFAGFFIGSLLTPPMIARVGHVRVFAALASIASIAILLHSLLVLPVAWALFRVMTGFAFAGLYIVAESWLNDQASNVQRGSLLALYMAVSYLGLAAGQAMLNIAAPEAATLFLVCSIVISAALVPILLSVAPQPRPDAPEPMSLRKLLRISPLGTVGCFATGIANGAFFGMAAVYARRTGLDVAGVSVFMTALVLGGAVLQWPLGRLSDVFDRRRVIFATAVGAVLAAALMQGLAGTAGWMFLGASALMGGFVLALYPLVLAYINDWLTPSQMVAGSSTLVLAYGGGAILGPSGAGWLMDLLGPAGFPAYMGAIHLGLAAFCLWRMTRRAAPEAQEDYIPSPAVASTAAPYLTEADMDTENDMHAETEVEPGRSEAG